MNIPGAAGCFVFGALAAITVFKTFRRRKEAREAAIVNAAENRAPAPTSPVKQELRYGTFAHKGNRNYMEDYQFATTEGSWGFFAVCDGHGGEDAARFTTDNLLRYFLTSSSLTQGVGCALEAAFLQVDRLFQKEVSAGRQQPSGTTALAAVILDKKVVVANAGDCRCILSQSGVAVEVGEKHSPESPKERDRIKAAGGFLDQDGYLCGQLGVSRAIGDHHLEELKSPGGDGPLIANPEVVAFDVRTEEEFMVLASDGLWMTPQTIVNIVRTNLRTTDCPASAAEEVAQFAMNDPTSKDNISVIVIPFKKIPAAQSSGKNRNSRLRINRS